MKKRRSIVKNKAFPKKGPELWNKAKKIIPGGNMLLSKRAEMSFAVGTSTLGYGNREVDQAVLRNIRNGNMCTLNCPEEVQLAEKLIGIHPWAQMARFARSGGEANAIAIRIARAASGKDKVAICGYHGWHDW